MNKTIHLIAAARPNFMKVAPLFHALARETWCTTRIVHTGQHYDANMSDAFFQDLALPEPAHHLGVGSGTHAEQTAGVMVAYERLCLTERPDLTIVVGDVNSTMACTVAAKKLLIPVAHLEAGLRSRDWTMPEEINRVLTDRLSDLLFTPSRDGDENLRREGIDPSRVHFVGNVMIDSLQAALPRAKESRIHERLELRKKGYALATLHRPANVDDPAALSRLLSALAAVAAEVPVVFPIHPRTRARLAPGFAAKGLKLVEPLGYLDFLALTAGARLVMTDSGGIQEETTALGVPCLTLRENTERPVTVEVGTNQLVGTDPEKAIAAAREVLAGRAKEGRLPELWDGRAAGRVAEVLVRYHERALRYAGRGE